MPTNRLMFVTAVPAVNDAVVDFYVKWVEVECVGGCVYTNGINGVCFCYALCLSVLITAIYIRPDVVLVLRIATCNVAHMYVHKCIVCHTKRHICMYVHI